MSGESVKVAVRVRPFNQREKDRGAKCVIEMKGPTTYIQNPETPNEDPKMFGFDYSYWSHDGFADEDGVLVAKNDKYATQRKVFDNLGQGVLDNAFEGYNCSLFAYGQTGSGKSFSMVGYGKNRGIVPITCDELFQAINKSSDGTKFEVTFSMLEIYNEQVRDLLTKDNPKGGLNVRQNPKLGLFYVEKLKKVAVGSYNEIERRMEEGTANRTVASTQMNATSSRAHTVVTITFDQIMKNEAGQETKKSSSINLVDLAGSERADSTGATGDRLKEGANINRSLSALGNVISALADLSLGKKKIVVPYRDSVLTKLLMSALGGNSKTIMIAALSPADINYDETLSTLRYADRAKKIKNKAVVNENPIDKLIRELREENERLKKAAGGVLPMQSQAGMSPEEIEEMRRKMQEEIRAQLLENQEQMKDLDWDAKLAESRKEDAQLSKDHGPAKMTVPHFVNLNEDPMLSGVIKHPLVEGKETLIGRKDAEITPHIILTGLSIQKQHASIMFDNEEIVIKPASNGARIKVNGAPLTGERKLEHHDRVLLGSNHLYVFINPLKPDLPEGTPESIDWDFAQKELAEQSGFSTQNSGMSKDQQRAQEQVLELLPMVSEVNAVSEELNKYRHFELVLISGGYQEDKDKGTKVMVQVKNLLNNNIWMWERGKFMNRRYIIQELYQQYIDGDDSYKNIEQDKDPFFDPPEDVMLGTANVFLQSLSYALDFDDKLAITDYKGQEEGMLTVAVTPCLPNGRSLDEESFIEDPSDLLGKPYHFKITIRNCEINNSRYSKGVYVRHKTLGDKDPIKTKVVEDTLSPEFNYSRIITIPSVNQEHLDYFESQSITFFVHGCQVDTPPVASVKKLTTKELREMDGQMTAPMLRRRNTLVASNMAVDSQLKSEIHTLQRKYDRLEKKEKRIQELCRQWSDKSPEEQDFEKFMNSIKAVAFSSGNKLKSRVQLVNHRDSDAFSVYSFEVTPEMKFISGLSEDPIQEEEEVSNESGSRRGSSPKKDHDTTSKDAKQSNGSPKRKSQSDKDSPQKHSNGKEKVRAMGGVVITNTMATRATSQSSLLHHTCSLLTYASVWTWCWFHLQSTKMPPKFRPVFCFLQACLCHHSIIVVFQSMIHHTLHDPSYTFAYISLIL
uniref:kinesin-like protein KIF28P isoform X4 n=1 Tax=Ciona intestinalis TaxID=7719 RepID=UPI000EF4AB22|nr:kinesin-like protein KIF28P isoform X4 [Ciona intestinalis]|eukprot:XP_026689448.1 kinesin-like protein KIF28P isoform X4 [Ciona intestinalis]